MELLSDLTTGFSYFTEQAQAICTAAAANLRAYATAGQSMAGTDKAPHYAITVFDVSKAQYGKECGEIVYQTNHAHTSPTAALEELGKFYNVKWPMAPAEYLTVSQSEDIQRLLNHPKIFRNEKTLMLLKYQLFSPERAEVAIKRLRKTIEDRENAPLDHKLAQAA